MEKQRSLGERLVQEGYLTLEQLQRALEEERRTRVPLHKILVKRGLAPDEVVASFLADEVGVPYVKLSDFLVDQEVLPLLPEDLCRRFKVFPLFKIGPTLTVATIEPANVMALDHVKRASGYDVDLVISTEAEILQAIDQYYGTRGSIAELVKGIDMQGMGLEDERTVTAERLAGVAEVAPVVKLVNLLIASAVRDKASDIHIEPEEDLVRVRLRIDGILHETTQLPKHLQPAIISRIKILSDLDIADARTPKDGRFRFPLEDKEVDLRVSIFPTLYGENVVLRILDRSGTLLKLSELGFAEETLKQYERLIAKPYGLVLVTGPTGSGKTTTLYATLNALNTPEKNIITIEDPVEYHLPWIRQSQVNPKAGVTFAAGLRSILRQDPDIIMVGEIRDAETAQTAIQAALTGHLVFSTLHTNDAVGALTRLMDMGVEPFLIASSTVGVLAQRLVRVICEKCKEPFHPPGKFLDFLPLTEKGARTFFRGRGCAFCKETGYRGRIGIFELLVLNEPIRELVLARAPASALKQEAVKQGMRDLWSDGLEKAMKGLTTLEEVLRAVRVEVG